jgi:hypothetical protein
MHPAHWEKKYTDAKSRFQLVKEKWPPIVVGPLNAKK